ncbi:MAG TPA: CBS domain-containing protein [Gaiellaceae bacterium]|jgi:CBS domain-containing protein|nr:CBS domain-containing protein [Gaiellaceae bacterium]
MSAYVADAMTVGIVSCAPDTPLREVAALMARHNVHAVYVYDEPGTTAEEWALVSDLDLVAAWPVLDDRTAGNSAVTPLVSIEAEDSLERAAQLMMETGSTHLAVVARMTGQPVGVLSTLDIARVVAV